MICHLSNARKSDASRRGVGDALVVPERLTPRGQKAFIQITRIFFDLSPEYYINISIIERKEEFEETCIQVPFSLMTVQI